MTGRDAPDDEPARILIVDDEPLNVDYLQQELESLGFETETATTGIEALEQVAAAAPDLVLLDVMMPGMDGIAALRLLKEDPETRLIPVVLMTALNAVEDRVRGIEAGADDFLSKPVDERELIARIKTALSHKRAIDARVGELESTSAHLQRYGRQRRELAVLVVEWRPAARELPAGAVGFVGRRERRAAEDLITGAGGTISELQTEVLVAAFDDPDPRARAAAAIDAALGIMAELASEGERRVTATAAVSDGLAEVGAFRLTRDGERRWLYGVEGDPVDRASEIARGATEAGLMVAGDAAPAVSERFRLEPVEGGWFRVGDPEESRAAPARMIRTIVVTDIVGSTRIVERVGDQAWTELSAEHDRATRDELIVFGGEEIDTTGDGFLASFETPERAIRYALSLMRRLGDLGLRIRVGIHTGEVDYTAGRARGIALNVATRVAERASSTEVLVSATTRELAAGSGLLFTDRGEHTLEGVTEPRRLYAAVEMDGAVEAGVPEPPPEAEYPAGLTAREVEVLRLVAVGLTDAEVAERLFLSVRTVNAHLRSVYRKLGVRSRAAAGRFAEEHDLL
jgi:DNA-binding NarL/FixJ family response regulator